PNCAARCCGASRTNGSRSSASDARRRRAEQLAVLHRLGRNVSRSLDVTSVCRAVHDSVTALMDCDAFFIVRFNAESEQREVVYLVEDGRRAPAMVLPMDDDVSSQVIRTREELGLDPSRASAGTPRPGWGCSPRARSLLCVPMILGERVVGAVAAQSEQPSAYDQGDVELLRLLAASAAAALENARRYEEVRDAATRLTVLNRVAQIVTSTLEGERVMELIYEQVSRVIPADSYFLATADLERDELYFEFMIDAGKRFAPEREPLGAGLSAWVLQNRAPLLLSNIPEQAAALGVEAKVWGEARPSLSWAGVPLLNGSTLLGLVAVASYEPDRFSQADVSLLQSIAQQAAIPLDNARHHAEVQEQARLDSLTRVYNHGYFLKRLAEEVDRAQAERRPLSLIMLDIDRFKNQWTQPTILRAVG
ncbi:MAG TPA: GAF domain-containing protein, partial [Ardenticatenaceae bacterium]|nr:GAF domain-containing protein [Ardenticatenaceae bacterium]